MDLPLLKVIKFLATGFLNTIFGYTIYATLLYFEIPYSEALLLATILGIIFNYISMRKFVFVLDGDWLIFFKFIITYFLIYILNAAGLDYLVNNFILNPYIAQILCIIPIIILNWLFMNYFVFKRTEKLWQKN